MNRPTSTTSAVMQLPAPASESSSSPPVHPDHGVGAHSRPGQPVSRTQERWARLIVWVYALASVLAVVLWLMRLLGPSHVRWPSVAFGTLNVPLTPSLVSVVTLFLLTGALLRRKRIALVVVGSFQVVGLLLSSGILVRIWGVDLEFVPDPSSVIFEIGVEALGVLVSIASLYLLWWVRGAFPARTRAGAVRAAALTLAVGTVISIGLTYVLLLVTTATAADNAGVLRTAVLHALGLRAGPRYHHHVPGWIPLLSSVLLSITILATVFVLLRSGRRTHAWTADQELALRGLLAEHGKQDSLSWFATRRDKEAVFAPDGRAAVVYRIVGSVCLTSGNPVGDPKSWSAAVQAWMGHARRYGWTPAVLAASEHGARTYVAAGLEVLTLGDEAVLHSDRFSLANTSLTDVRRAVRHARREGLSVQIRHHSDLDPAELGHLGELADRWRGNEPDRGFSMALNRWGDPADTRCVVVTAHRPDGEVVGLLSFVPWGRRGLSLDVMRRSPAAPNGTTELMVAELMDQAAARGIAEISLNFAMFRGVFADAERLGAGAITRLNSSVLGYLDRFFQLERLYRSNDKYLPQWVPRYLCFDGKLSLPRVAVAAARAEGFLPAPLRRHEPDRRLTDDQLARVRSIEAIPSVSHLAPRDSYETRHRRRHARMLQEAGEAPYPVGLPTAVPVAELNLSATAGSVRVWGRIRALRRHGGVLFIDLVDGGLTVQAVVERAALGPKRFRLLEKALDTGDVVVVTAVVGASRTGTPSLLARDLTVAAKALQPVPFTGFEDPGARARRRSTDLLIHPRALDVLTLRSRALTGIRHFMDVEGFREVETPVFNPVHGGATARPFRTYSNAYGVDLTLRIAPELYLKRLLVAEGRPIFEIARNFRNEGADATHNPEFTSLEAYRPFDDYTGMRLLTERLIKAVATEVHGAPLLPLRDAHDPAATPALTDVSAPWPVVPVSDAVSEAVGRPVSIHSDLDELLALARDHKVAIGPGLGPGAVLEELYGELVESSTTRPTFYCDFPAETSPLAAPHRSRPGLVERWDLVAGGMEIGTAYSELTDPLEQRRRLTEQSLRAAAGDVEAMAVDEDFLYALQTGMPPAGGLGIGVDRLVMLLTAATIRDVLSFPFVRPEPRA